MKTNNSDPLAHASETPDISALIAECERAQTDGPARRQDIAAAEDVQYNRRSGKSNPPDGKRWQSNAGTKTIVKPYDGCPDSDVHLADDIILGIVDIICMAAEMAQIGVRSNHLTKERAAAMGELRAVADYCRRVTAEDKRTGLELTAQRTAKLGWSVLNPGWRERYELVERELDLESFVNEIVQTFGPDQAKALYTAILDPALADQAADAIGQLFSYVPKGRRKTIVRELRETRQTKFLDRQLSEKRPTSRTLIQGYDYFVLGSARKLTEARGHLIIERLNQAELESTAASEGWNEAFVEAALGTAGQFSGYSEAMRDQAQFTDQQSRDYSVEIWTTCYYQFDQEIGAGGNYYTVFSPHIKPPSLKETTAAHYAKHFLLAYACGAPFVQTRLFVEGPGVDDSRGVPEMVRSDQAILKMLQDAEIVAAHKQADPPLGYSGFGFTKLEGWNKPGAASNLGTGGDAKILAPTGNLNNAEAAVVRLEAGTRKRFALPNNTDGSHPSAWQTRQVRIVKAFLAALAEELTQQVVLCYQEFGPEELAEIIGHWPALSLEDVLKHRITLSFDVRGLDPDWRNDLIGMVKELMGMDKGGRIDTDPAIELLGSVFDPTLISAIVRDQQGASEALYRKVQDAVNDIMLGNPPPLVENDASAGKQLEYAFQIVGQNQDYQRVLQENPQKRENLKTYVQNLQHSVQETQLSPVQGKLGVKAMPQRPVQQGAP